MTGNVDLKREGRKENMKLLNYLKGVEVSEIPIFSIFHSNISIFFNGIASPLIKITSNLKNENGIEFGSLQKRHYIQDMKTKKVDNIL